MKMKYNHFLTCPMHGCKVTENIQCPMCQEDINENSDAREIEYLAGLFEKLKDFYAQPVDGFWPLRLKWCPDLRKPPYYISPFTKFRCHTFRRFTLEEFITIFKMENWNGIRERNQADGRTTVSC